MKKFKIILVGIFIAILFLSDLLITQANWDPENKSQSSEVLRFEVHTNFNFNRIGLPKLLY
jgi:hypothetical protein